MRCAGEDPLRGARAACARPDEPLLACVWVAPSSHATPPAPRCRRDLRRWVLPRRRGVGLPHEHAHGEPAQGALSIRICLSFSHSPLEQHFPPCRAFLDGGTSWDASLTSAALPSSRPSIPRAQVLFSKAPILWLKPSEVSEFHEFQHYECPLCVRSIFLALLDICCAPVAAASLGGVAQI